VTATRRVGTLKYGGWTDLNSRSHPNPGVFARLAVKTVRRKPSHLPGVVSAGHRRCLNHRNALEAA